jgi:hypothetical protein
MDGAQGCFFFKFLFDGNLKEVSDTEKPLDTWSLTKITYMSGHSLPYMYFNSVCVVNSLFT